MPSAAKDLVLGDDEPIVAMRYAGHMLTRA